MSLVAPRSKVSPGEKCFSIADVAKLPTELPSGTVDYELDNGRLITMVPPGDMHGAVQAQISSELLVQGQRRGAGLARAEVGIVLWRNPDRLVAADAAFILNRSLPLRHSPEGYLETIPELVVEVRSKNDSAADVKHKVDDYLTAGVHVVLVADPSTKSVTLYSRDNEPHRFSESETLVLESILPDFRCSVADLFRD
jgi:Uma2 family endonuclease